MCHQPRYTGMMRNWTLRSGRVESKVGFTMPKVIIAAFDGLLPQQVTPDLTPNIHALSSSGVTFRRNHSVFPTVTRVNSATMVTGVYSGKHGIPANRAVIPDHDPHIVTDVLQPELDAISSNPSTPVLFVPTIGEILAERGLSHVSVVGGTSGNAYVHFPRAAETGIGGVIHPEFSLPGELKIADDEILGPWPGSQTPNLGRVRRVGETALRYVIPELNPDLLFVWFSEPDMSNHAFGIGSDQSNSGLNEGDAALGRILDVVRERGEEPDVFVISDHGYSTISATTEVFDELRSAGFRVDDGEGSVLVGSNGGSALFNYPGVSEDEIARLARWLCEREWAGAVFSSLPQTADLGLLPISLTNGDGPRAPHFTVSMNWTAQHSANEIVGHSYNSGPSAVGSGTHGSASPHQIRNTLIASGPSFKSGTASDAPSGNVDLAPTVLNLFGIEAPDHMDGRVLSEALMNGPDSNELQVEESQVTASSSENGVHTARTVTVSGRTYLEQADFRTG